MELKELRTFTTAARLRSISKAAEQLDIGQPTATTHIKKLEDEIGTLLFDRVKRPIQLTLAGATLARLANPLLDGIETLVAQTAAEEEDGPVSVACIHVVISHLLLPVVSSFHAQSPRSRLQIRPGHTREILQMIKAGDVDMGIAVHNSINDEFDFVPMFPYERVLMAPLGHPILEDEITSLEQITRWPLVLMGPHTLTRTVLEEELRRKGLAYDLALELDDLDMIKRYVATGIGISIGPRFAIDADDHKRLGVYSLMNLLPVEQTGILTLRGKSLSRPARNFIDVTREILGRQLT